MGGYAPISKADHEDARAPPYEHMTQSIVTGQPLQRKIKPMPHVASKCPSFLAVMGDVTTV